MTPPTGEQYEIASAGYRAVVTESGGTLRLLEHDGRALLDGFAEGEMPTGGRGQLLVPWCNRIQDGSYAFEGRTLQVALSEPSRHNASHGLVRWVAWSLRERRPDGVSLGYRLMAQTGYPWTLELEVRYQLSRSGLHVTQSATNLSDTGAPYGSGAHPYLSAGSGPVDAWELTLAAATRVLTDDRKLPTGTEEVAGTDHDLGTAGPVGSLVLDDAFTGLQRDATGRAWVHLRGEHDVSLWADERHGWLQLYTADDAPGAARRSLAVEPMTAPANAFRTGHGLRTLTPGARFEATWGITATGVGAAG